MIRPVYISIDASSFDDELPTQCSSCEVLRDLIHMHLLKRFAEVYESFPRPDEMELIDRDLMKIEARLTQAILRRGFKVSGDLKKS